MPAAPPTNPHEVGEERKMSVEKVKSAGEGANAKTHLIGCGENAAPKSVYSKVEYI